MNNILFLLINIFCIFFEIISLFDDYFVDDM